MKEQLIELKKTLGQYENECKLLKSTVIQLETQCKRKVVYPGWCTAGSHLCGQDEDIAQLLQVAEDTSQPPRASTAQSSSKTSTSASVKQAGPHLVIALRHQVNSLRRDNKTLSSQYDKVRFDDWLSLLVFE